MGPKTSLPDQQLELETPFQVATCACGESQEGFLGDQAGAVLGWVAHLPGCCVQPVLLTDGNQLLPVQVAIPGDPQVLTDLLELLLDPVWAR